MSEDIAWKQYQKRFTTYPSLLQDDVDQMPEMFVCIPSYAEPGITDTLQSLSECDKTRFRTGVIILFNQDHRMKSDELKLHRSAWDKTITWVSRHQTERLKFFPLHLPEIPGLHGGVGLARKILQDEAAGKLPDEGVIISLDADCRVDKNYLNEIHDQFVLHPDCSAASVHFEHPLDNLSDREKDSIVRYELHLRYLVNAQRWCGHPFAFHTVGSSMAVRRKDYLLQGGMNTRQAGEDFYFLQKFIETGKFFKITNTTVYPGVRISNRVPFGTGKAMHQILDESLEWLTTDFKIFRLIKPVFASLEKLNSVFANNRSPDLKRHFPEWNDAVFQFMEETDFSKAVSEINLHTKSSASFQKRFFRYFNSFHMIRYTHWMRDHHYPDVSVRQAIEDFLKELSIRFTSEGNLDDYLRIMRRMDKNILSEDFCLRKME
jgi:hypothetical protein